MARHGHAQPRRRRRVAVLAMFLVGCAGGTSSQEPADDETPPVPTVDADHPDVDAAPDADGDPEWSAPRPLALDDSWAAECAAAGARADVAPERVVELFVEMRPDDLDGLYTRDPEADDRLEALYLVRSGDDDVAAGTAGIRFRGNSSRQLPKKSFNIDLDRHVPEVATDRLNLNALYTDPSMVREWLSFAVFRELGVTASDTRLVDLYLNDVYEGLYLQVQRVDEQLLADAGLAPVDATMVRDRSRQVLDGHGSILEEFVPPLADRAEVVAHLPTVTDSRGDPDWDAVADLALWTQSLRDLDDAALVEDAERLEAELSARVDVEALIDFAVGQVLVGDVDWFSDDYWLVRATAEERFRLVPWDKDLSFGSHWSEDQGRSTNHFFHLDWELDGRMLDRNPLTRVAFVLPSVRQRFHERLDEALGETFTTQAICEHLVAVVPPVAERVDRRSPDDGFARHGQQHFAGLGEHDLHVSVVLDYVQRRSAFLRASLAAERTGAGPLRREPEETMTATETVAVDDVGSTVWFVDASGWTIARLDVHEVTEPGDVTVAVARDGEFCELSPCDVDRVWSIDTGGASLSGRLSVYFRNNVAHGDWYRPGPGGTVDAVGGQHELGVVELVPGVDGTVSPDHLDSRSNPYSDRVMALVELDGTHQFVLAH